MDWLSDLARLKDLEQDLALLPVGNGKDFKGPLLNGWQHHDGYTVEQLQSVRNMRSVGARTGLLTGPLIGFDFDGMTSVDFAATERDIAPWDAVTWQIHRTTDPFRLKVLFRPTPDQLKMLPEVANPSSGCHVSPEFQQSRQTAPPVDNKKGEALEVFFAGGRQIILLGEHPSSGGYYFWPDGLGPEALTAPPESWWNFAIEMALKAQEKRSTGSKPSRTRNGTTRLQHCPICGRHDGVGGSSLWCDRTDGGLILCMPGSTFSPTMAHPGIEIGDVVNGYALKKITDGVHTFGPHVELDRTRSTRKPWRPSRPSRRLAKVAS